MNPYKYYKKNYLNEVTLRYKRTLYNNLYYTDCKQKIHFMYKVNQLQMFIVNIIYILFDLFINRIKVAIWERCIRSLTGLVFYFLGRKFSNYTP